MGWSLPGCIKFETQETTPVHIGHFRNQVNSWDAIPGLNVLEVPDGDPELCGSFFLCQGYALAGMPVNNGVLLVQSLIGHC